MQVTTTKRLPVPELTNFRLEHSHKQAHRRGEDNRNIRPPKLKGRDTNISRSSYLSTSISRSPHAISFRNDDITQLTNDDDSHLLHCTFYNRSDKETYFKQCFEVLGKLGEGSFGEVFKVQSKEDGHFYAVKVSKQLFRSEYYRQERLEEVRRYEQFSGHANCVRFYRAWEQNDRLYMQMELCRENLEYYLERKKIIDEEKIWSILLDLLLALKSLHDRNLIHLDIKLDNVLISDDGVCKLADFGLVIDVDRANRYQATEGDSRYIAPEILQGNFSKAADIFSLGIAMLELACFLELPTNGPLWQQLRSGILPSDFLKMISPELQAIIKLMLTPEQEARPTVDQLLNHKKIAGIVQNRKRWLRIRKMVQTLRRARRTVWTKLCNFKNIFFNLITNFLIRLRSATKRIENNTNDDQKDAQKYINTNIKFNEEEQPCQRSDKLRQKLFCSTPRQSEYDIDTGKNFDFKKDSLLPYKFEDGTEFVNSTPNGNRSEDFGRNSFIEFENPEVKLSSSLSRKKLNYGSDDSN